MTREERLLQLQNKFELTLMGYMIVKIEKDCITIALYSEDRESLVWSLNNGNIFLPKERKDFQIVEYYQDYRKTEYIKVDGKHVRIN